MADNVMNTLTGINSNAAKLKSNLRSISAEVKGLSSEFTKLKTSASASLSSLGDVLRKALGGVLGTGRRGGVGTGMPSSGPMSLSQFNGSPVGRNWGASIPGREPLPARSSETQTLKAGTDLLPVRSGATKTPGNSVAVFDRSKTPPVPKIPEMNLPIRNETVISADSSTSGASKWLDRLTTGANALAAGASSKKYQPGMAGGSNGGSGGGTPPPAITAGPPESGLPAIARSSPTPAIPNVDTFKPDSGSPTSPPDFGKMISGASEAWSSFMAMMPDKTKGIERQRSLYMASRAMTGTPEMINEFDKESFDRAQYGFQRENDDMRVLATAGQVLSKPLVEQAQGDASYAWAAWNKPAEQFAQGVTSMQSGATTNSLYKIGIQSTNADGSQRSWQQQADDLYNMYNVDSFKSVEQFNASVSSGVIGYNLSTLNLDPEARDNIVQRMKDKLTAKINKVPFSTDKDSEFVKMTGVGNPDTNVNIPQGKVSERATQLIEENRQSDVKSFDYAASTTSKIDEGLAKILEKSGPVGDFFLTLSKTFSDISNSEQVGKLKGIFTGLSKIIPFIPDLGGKAPATDLGGKAPSAGSKENGAYALATGVAGAYAASTAEGRGGGPERKAPDKPSTFWRSEPEKREDHKKGRKDAPGPLTKDLDPTVFAKQEQDRIKRDLSNGLRPLGRPLGLPDKKPSYDPHVIGINSPDGGQSLIGKLVGTFKKALPHNPISDPLSHVGSLLKGLPKVSQAGPVGSLAKSLLKVPQSGPVGALAKTLFKAPQAGPVGKTAENLLSKSPIGNAVNQLIGSMKELNSPVKEMGGMLRTLTEQSAPKSPVLDTALSLADVVTPLGSNYAPPSLIAGLSGSGSDSAGSDTLGGVAGGVNTGDAGPAPTEGGPEKRAAWIVKRLQAEGLSNAQIAAIMGNLQTESAGTYDPNINQYGGGPGRGIVQWSEGGRWNDLVSWAKKKKLNPRNLETQVEFMLHEMQGIGGFRMDKFKKMTNVQEAARYFGKEYEIYGVEGERYSYADQWFKKLNKGQAKPSRSAGAWRLPHDEVANVHQGEMIIPAQIAEAVREAISGGGGKTMNVNLNVTLPNATRVEAEQLVKMVADEMRRFSRLERVGSV